MTSAIEQAAMPESHPMNAMEKLTPAEAWRGPDFIIGGAMKCATTSLHHVLASHRQIYIPDGEIHFFDFDDIVHHPDYFPWDGRRWISHDFQRDYEANLAWYRDKFAAAGDAICWGEDSPSYLSSDRAAERICKFRPDMKLIFILRDPVARIYSHYWHWVATRRTWMSFEEMIRFSPGTLISRGFYARALRRFYDVFPRSQMRVVLFEQLVANLQHQVTPLLDFLGVDPSAPLDFTRKNEGSYPRFLKLKLLENWSLRELAGRRHRNRPGVPPPRTLRLWERAICRLSPMINPMRAGKSPPMRSESVEFLADLYRRENEGLSELIGIRVEDCWASYNAR